MMARWTANANFWKLADVTSGITHIVICFLAEFVRTLRLVTNDRSTTISPSRGNEPSGGIAHMGGRAKTRPGGIAPCFKL